MAGEREGRQGGLAGPAGLEARCDAASSGSRRATRSKTRCWSRKLCSICRPPLAGSPPLETHFDPKRARSTVAAGRPRRHACFVRTMSLLLLIAAAAEGFQKPSERMPSDLHGPRPLPDDPDALAAVQQ